jgi:hypothetical protein
MIKPFLSKNPCHIACKKIKLNIAIGGNSPAARRINLSALRRCERYTPTAPSMGRVRTHSRNGIIRRTGWKRGMPDSKFARCKI